MKTINIFSVIIFLLIGGSVLAQRQLPPEGGTPKDFTLPSKVSKTLGNGMKSMLVQYGAVPKVNIQLIVKTGNIHEDADEVWLADLTANLMREGTTSMDFASISRKVAGMGGEINVGVGIEQTTISGSVLSEYAGDLLALIGDIAMNPSFPESEIDRLKNDLKRQLAIQKTQPGALAREQFSRMIYPGHPYGRYFSSDEILDSFTLEMVKDFYQKNFGAKRSVIYVVGKFDEVSVTSQIENTYSKWLEGPDVSYPAVDAERTNEVAQIDRADAPQTTIIVGIPTLTPKDPDYITLQVTNSLLGGSFGSRITMNIREDKGYTYSPSSTVQNRRGGSVWYEQADVTTEHTGATLMEIAMEISQLQNETPSEDEVEGIQKFEAGLFVLRNSSPQGIIGQLNFLDLHGLDDSFLTNRVQNIYAVTPEKVSQLARDHLKYEDMVMVLVGDKTAIERQKKELDDSRKIH